MLGNHVADLVHDDVVAVIAGNAGRKPDHIAVGEVEPEATGVGRQLVHGHREELDRPSATLLLQPREEQLQLEGHRDADSPVQLESFNRDEYEQVTDVLKRFFNIIITDSGTGLTHSAMAGALETTRSLVIVGAPTVDAAELASRTLDWISARGFDDLVDNAVVALSFDRYSRDVDRSAVVEHFASCCRAVVEIPEDRHLATGGHIQLEHLQPRTLDAALTLAAHVADEFTRTPQRAEPLPPAGQRG